MKKTFVKIGWAFAAGCLGAAAVNIFILVFGTLGIAPAVGIDFAPDFDAADLYSDLGWGGLWGLLFLLPFMNESLIAKGALLSLIPTAFQLAIVFPFFERAPFVFQAAAFVFLYNVLWGIAAGLFLSNIDFQENK